MRIGAANSPPMREVPGFLPVLTELSVFIDAPSVARFWEHVDKTPGFGPNGDCWRWTGYLMTTGHPYGLIDVTVTIPGLGRGNIKRTAHRISFLIHRGYLTQKDICHSCDNPQCVNPAHLWEGTHEENMEDRDRKRRNGFSERTHCHRGHPFGETPLRNNKGARVCKTCIKQNRKERRAQRKALGLPPD